MSEFERSVLESLSRLERCHAEGSRISKIFNVIWNVILVFLVVLYIWSVLCAE